MFPQGFLQKGMGKHECMSACYHPALLICVLGSEQRRKLQCIFGLLVMGGMRSLYSLYFALKFLLHTGNVERQTILVHSR